MASNQTQSPVSSPGFIRPGRGGVLSHFLQENQKTAEGDNKENRAPDVNRVVSEPLPKKSVVSRYSLRSSQRFKTDRAPLGRAVSANGGVNTRSSRRRPSVKSTNTSSRREKLMNWKKEKGSKKSQKKRRASAAAASVVLPSNNGKLRKRKSILRQGNTTATRGEQRASNRRRMSKEELLLEESEDVSQNVSQDSGESKEDQQAHKWLRKSVEIKPPDSSMEEEDSKTSAQDFITPIPEPLEALASSSPMPSKAQAKTVVFGSPHRQKKGRTRSQPVMSDVQVPSTPAAKVMVANMRQLQILESPSAVRRMVQNKKLNKSHTNMSSLVHKLTATKMQRELLMAQTRSLQLELKKTRKIVTTLRAQLLANSEASNSPSTITVDSDEINKLTVELKEVTANKENLEVALAQAQAQLDESKENERVFKGKMADGEDRRTELEELVQVLESQVATLKLKVSENGNENKSLLTRVKAAESSAAAAAEAEREAHTRVEEVERQLRAQTEESSRAAGMVLVLREKMETLRGKRQTEEIVRRRLHNRVQDLLGRVRVFCRLRPMSGEKNESQSCDFRCSIVDGAGVLQVVQRGCSVSGLARSKKTKFVFDGVLPQHASQRDIFEYIGPLVTSSMDGYDVTIFAYGQTGSGKTYTMFGPADVELSSDERRGVIPRAVDLIFDIIKDAKTKQWVYKLSVSILEIYNESIRDLLQPSQGNRNAAKHEIKTDKSGRVFITKLRQVKVDSAKQLHALTLQASAQSSRSSTDLNARSSRSHTLFRLHISGKNTTSKQSVESVMTLVDLAGSERVSKSKVVGERLEETKNINASLSSLGACVKALAGGSSHVPYRNSKLTYLLHSALAGSGKTMFLINVSPEADSISESLCTLRFAESLKDVKSK